MQPVHQNTNFEPATKSDLRDLKSDVDSRFGDLRDYINARLSDMNSRITDMNGRIADMNGRVAGLQDDIRAMQSANLGLRNGIVVALLAAAATAIFTALLA